MGRRIAVMFLGLVILIVLAALLGPRVAVETKIRFDPSRIGDDPQAYLIREEAKLPDIRDGLEKEIIWANPMIHAKTPLAVVYIHGFSASKEETRPLADKVAEELDANLFYTRLTGHGQGGPAMAEGNVNAWINDYEEALAIGRSIGDKVIVIATSTGASLATWAASQPDASRDVMGMALISPNYGVQASGAEMLLWPWGKQLAELIIGKERSFVPRNALQEKYWTWRYPSTALLPMAALTKLAYDAPVGDAKCPRFSSSRTTTRWSDRSERVKSLRAGARYTKRCPSTTAAIPTITSSPAMSCRREPPISSPSGLSSG